MAEDVVESKMDMQMKEEKKSTDTISSGSGDSQNAKMDTSTKEESTTTSQTISNNSATTTTAASVVSEESEQSEQANKMTSESANKQGTVSTPSTQSATPKETVDFKIVYNKRKYDITFELDNTVANLKQHIQTLTAVPPAMQKVMFKGLMKDDKTLRDSKVIKGAKVMVVGSTLTDVIAVNTPAAEAAKEEKTETEPTKEPLSKQKPHLKIIEKGKPDDALPGLKGVKERLPSVPLSGMVNKSGGKVRLTFKLEQDQLWLGTK
ncbi:ubiquitin domain-containing protein UBFD1-like, partial [Saccoglossus kowalevskii]|uniref:Ubiquitin domain-containing protein UBFD1-like n=1 Tax=Saccoglossus kowalevskii TaxID=10224 RepID=A0ABM0GKV2_SACKO